MNKSWFKHTITFIILYLIQLLLLNKITLFGFVTPMIYIMFIMCLPFNSPKWLLVLLGFTSGLIMDCFTGALGFHALSMLVIAFLRPAIIHIIPYNGKKEEHLQPIFHDMKGLWYLQYAFCITFIHHFIYYMVDSMSMAHFGHTLWVILVNTLFTIICIYIAQMLFYKPSKRY